MKTKNYQWGPGQRKTVPQMFQWAIETYRYPTKASNVSDLRFERSVWLSHRKRLKRDAVGMIRAMGAVYFFNGCYKGAEND